MSDVQRHTGSRVPDAHVRADSRRSEPDSRRSEPDDRPAEFGRRAGESADDYRLVTETMVRLADTLPGSVDISQAMNHLIRACAELTSDGEASILVADDDGVLAIYATTSERKQVIDEHQLGLGEGWILDAFRTGESALGVSLAESRDRWPSVAPLVLLTGVRTLNTIPLRYHGDVVGVLDLCDVREFPLSDLQVELLTALAESAGVGIGNRRTHRGKEVLAQQLQGALDSRILIEQAKGLIAGALGVSTDQAFTWLRSFSRGEGRKIQDVARLVVEGGLLPEAFRLDS